MADIVGLFSPAVVAIVAVCSLLWWPLLVCFPLLGVLADSSFLLSPPNDSVGQSHKG